MTTFYPFYFIALLIILLIAFFRSLPLVRSVLLPMGRGDAAVLVGIVLAGMFLRYQYSSHADLDLYCWTYIKSALAVAKSVAFPEYGNYLLNNTENIPGYSVLISPLVLYGRWEAVSLLNLVFSTLTIIVVYTIARLVTRESLAALLSAFLITISFPHIYNSGLECPASLSVLTVALEWLFFLLWLQTKDARAGDAFFCFLFFSFNLKKGENIIFLPVFVLLSFLYFGSRRHGLLSKRYVYVFLVMLVTFALMAFPFLDHVMKMEAASFRLQANGFNAMLSWHNMINNLSCLWRTYWGAVVTGAGGLVFLALMGERKWDLVVIVFWFLGGLSFYLWYAVSTADLNTRQILVPLFILQGYIYIRLFEVFNLSPLMRSVVATAFMGFFFVINSLPLVQMQQDVQWPGIQQQLKALPSGACIASLEHNKTVLFVLRLLAPDKKIVDLSDLVQGRPVACLDGTYYLNVVPYGLMDEIPWRVVENMEKELRVRYRIERLREPGERGLLLYRLQPRQGTSDVTGM